MTDSVESFLKNFPGKPFAVQFVLSITVAGHDRPLTQIKTYLLAASSMDDAREAARDIVEDQSFAYKNVKGELVTTECLGIHRILEPDYVYEGRWLRMDNFIYSDATRPEHLINEPQDRADLPELGQ